MKRVSVTILLLMFVFTSFSQKKSSHSTIKKVLVEADTVKKTSIADTTKTILIPEGTVIRVRSLNPINSRTDHEGDLVDFEAYDNVDIDGFVVIKSGAIVRGFIESSEHARGLGKAGELKIQFNYARAIDKTKVPLRSTKGTIEGDNKVGAAIALAVVVTPLFLFKKGKEARIPEGKLMEAYVSRDVTVKVPLKKHKTSENGM